MTETVCETVEDEVCRARFKLECRDITRFANRQKCDNELERECEAVADQECADVEKEECEDTTEAVEEEVCDEGEGTQVQGCQMAKFDPFLSLDCARVEGVGAQSKERKGSNFAA